MWSYRSDPHLVRRTFFSVISSDPDSSPPLVD